MIDFQIAPVARELLAMTRKHNVEKVRPMIQKYDEYEFEHTEYSDEEIKDITDFNKATMVKILEHKGQNMETPMVRSVMLGEEQAWGAPMAAGGSAKAALGNAAINAVATEDQKKRFGKLHAAMAITEPGCGSDTAAITTTAKLDEATNEWIINGEKIFITAGVRCEAVVVWATLDKSIGRAAIKSFVVEKTRKGCTVSKQEHKLGIRSSDTASIVFEDCRIPYDNILGSPEIKDRKKGFGGVMATFDATRPGVAAMAIGVGQAALDLAREKLAEEGILVDYVSGIHTQSAVQRLLLEMEANLDTARILIWRAAAMLDKKQRNSLEASMAKGKAGRAATQVTQKCLELLGPLGYTREWFAEKFMRDCKINDIFEGTGQIQMLIIARNILGFSRDKLK